MRRSLFALALPLAALLLLALGVPAQAHSSLLTITPADGAQVGAAPTRVSLVFNEPIEPDGTSVVVTAPDGAVVSTGATSVVGARVTQAMGPLTEKGRYAVSFRITSEDGHPVTASRSFTLLSGAPAPAAALGSTSSGGGGSQVLVAVLAVVALLMVGGIGAVGLRRRATA